jgi:pimeloyl-ACP methyl ester carboxylesterase
MIEAVHGGRPVPLGARLAAVLAVPLAPLFGLLVAYRICHPPPPRRQRTSSAFGLNPTQLWITVSPGRTRLHAWYLPGGLQRVVVLGHGLGLDKSFSLAQAQLLHQAGHTVVLFDFRNHGASFRDHALTRFSHRVNDDLVAVVDHVRNMPEHARARVAVWGFSFSTFPVLDTLAHLHGAVQAVLCDSGPTPTSRDRQQPPPLGPTAGAIGATGSARADPVAGGLPAAGHGHPRSARRLAAGGSAGRQHNADAVGGRRPRHRHPSRPGPRRGAPLPARGGTGGAGRRAPARNQRR